MIFSNNKKTAILALIGCVLALGQAEAAETPIKNLTITGDIRLLYADYNSNDDYSPNSFFKNVRNRVNLNYQIDPHTTATIGLYDSRYPNAHQYDRGAYIYRGNISGQYKKFGYTVGRMEHDGVDEFVLETVYLDGVKLRFGPRTKYVETFIGNVLKNSEGQHPAGFYVKGVQHWKHWSGKTALYQFTNEDATSAWNHQKIWSNTLTYRFDSKNSLSYERLNAWGENYGVKADSQSGYVLRYCWNNLDLNKPNTLMVSAGYFHQPQGSYINENHAAMAYVDAFNWYGNGGKGFKGPGIYVGYTLANNVLLNIEAYDLSNIYGSKKQKQRSLACYLNFFY